MPPLDYESRTRPAVRPDVPAAVVALPVVSTLLLFFVVFHNMSEEPFGVFSALDLIIQVGGPAVSIVLWAAWFAITRRHLRWVVLGPILGWAAMHTHVAVWLIDGYFREPWNP